MTSSQTHAGLPVKGYSQQSDVSVLLVNNNKLVEEGVLRLLDALADLPSIDKRWLAVGRTQIEQGFMAVNRAVFKPDRIKIPGDEAHP